MDGEAGDQGTAGTRRLGHRQHPPGAAANHLPGAVKGRGAWHLVTQPVLVAELRALRRLWRAFPPEALERHPRLSSVVWLDENGSRIAISHVSGRFAVPLGGGVATFVRLDDAELFAAGVLAEREGIPA